MPGLPVACRIVRALAAGNIMRKAAVIELAHPVYTEQHDRFVVLVKGTETIDDIKPGMPLGVFLMPLDARAGNHRLDLSAGLQPVRDWGALVLTREAAEAWQAK